MKVLITQALPEECTEIVLPDAEIRRVYTSIGKVMASYRLSEAIFHYNPDIVLNVGTAGTLSHQVGDIILCTEFIDRDMQRIKHLGIDYKVSMDTVPDKTPWNWNACLRGICNTGDSFVTEPEALEGDAVDMEAYAQALVCKERNIPFMSVKYITDIIGQNSVKHWQEKLAEADKALCHYFQSITLKNKEL